MIEWEPRKGIEDEPMTTAPEPAVIHMPANTKRIGLARVTRDVAYRPGAAQLVMDIIAPQSLGDDGDRRYRTIERWVAEGSVVPDTWNVSVRKASARNQRYGSA
ncbi:hypothetical protein [Bifidobacterium aesculapii]|uniref:hypothetical protein n=1 Tax=Bifidobacterium aesculapii TaxID=1329411 RepID=UPI0006E3A673|nr:hypothetical protein [Bifidobacterium aesculapii]